MMDEREIAEIIDRVQRRLATADSAHPGTGMLAGAEVAQAAQVELGDGIHATVDDAVAAAQRAFGAFGDHGLERRKTVIEAVRTSMLGRAEQLARMAHSETGIGRYDDKVVKNRLVTTKAPGPEDLEVQAVSGDNGMMVTEWAPYGVIGSISPTTNPTSTIINNSIAMISAGNTGATMASALLRMGRISGVKRPAIATPIPVPGSTPTVLLDAGANSEVQAEWLVQFALMGSVYARHRFGIEPDEDRKRAGEMPPGCDCARVVLGRIYPNECVLYGKACTPRKPIGPCMVSDEGACRIWWASGVRDQRDAW